MARAKSATSHTTKANQKKQSVDSPIYVTIVMGKQPYSDQTLMHPGAVLRAEKEPDNDHDKEAIKLSLPVGGICGYIANSTYTVAEGTYSAGRLYDKMGDVTYIKVAGRIKGHLIGFVLGDDPVSEQAWQQTLIRSADKPFPPDVYYPEIVYE